MVAVAVVVEELEHCKSPIVVMDNWSIMDQHQDFLAVAAAADRVAGVLVDGTLEDRLDRLKWLVAVAAAAELEKLH